MSDKIKELEKEIESLKDTKTIIETQIEKSVDRLNKLKEKKKYFINVFGEVEDTKGLRTINVVCMENQGNVFDSYSDAVKESQKRLLKKTIEKFKNECNEGWKPDFVEDSNPKHCIVLHNNELSVLATFKISYFAQFGYFKNEKDARKAIELFGDAIVELYND